MAKITLIDGTVIEGTIGELAELSAKLGADEQGQTESITFKGAEYTLVQRKAQPGDVVVFTESTSACVTNGKTYGPVVESRGDLGFTGDVGNTYDVYYNHYNRTVDNVKVYAPVAEVAPNLSEGDYVKTLSDSKFETIKKGSIGKLTKIRRDGLYVIVPIDNSAANGLFYEHQLEKVSAEEVAEAKLAEQFAKLGRKPNEFKVGDIAKVIDSPCASPDGTLIEIIEVCDEHVIGSGWSAFLDRVTTYGYDLNGHIELIAPVESRVDSQ